MRILHVVPSLGPQRGGPSFTARALATGLAHAGQDVHMAATDDDGPGRLDVALDTPIHEGGVTYWYFPRQTRFYTASWPLTRWLGQHMCDFDLVHIHALFSYASLAAAVCARRHGVPYIVRPLGTLNRWGMQRRRPLLKKLSFYMIERQIIAGAAAMHYTSEQERLEATKLGVAQRSVIIPNPVDITPETYKRRAGQFCSRYPWLANRVMIVFLGRLNPVKALDLLLPAFARVRAARPKAVLVLAGDGEPSFVAGLRAEAGRLGIAQNILWAGFLAGDAKLAALADADLFVLPSYSENFGNAVVEAMACCLPVIISDQVGIHNEISASGAGIVVPCQVAALAEAISQLVCDTGRRQEMGSRGQQLAQERFSPQVITTQLIELYRAVTQTIPHGAII
jgi:glycosyltransferase involved in cell wall biosynthesis